MPALNNIPAPAVSSFDRQRQQALLDWLSSILKINPTLVPLQQSASLRRYFRIQKDNIRYVVMDSTDLAACTAFVNVANIFQSLNLHVPKIYAADLQQGFLLLSDLGDQLYERALNTQSADGLYQQTFASLLRIQACPRSAMLPTFDGVAYQARMTGFCEWYLQGLLNLKLTTAQQQVFAEAFTILMTAAQTQPQVCIHYDYHCRNLLLLEQGQVGILDFQDAKWGPITYDLMSLLRDCYLDWPVAQVEAWIAAFQQQAQQAGILPEQDPQLFLRWCDFAGLQAHFKNAGIFARLSLQENMHGYLKYLPRVLRYIHHVCGRYQELAEVKHLLDRCAA
jgi:hypothetical protein